MIFIPMGRSMANLGRTMGQADPTDLEIKDANDSLSVYFHNMTNPWWKPGLIFLMQPSQSFLPIINIPVLPYI